MNKVEKGKCLLAAVMAGIVVLIFHFDGVSVFEELCGRSLFLWMTNAWKTSGTTAVDSSLGFIVPLISVFFIWNARKDLIEVRKCTDRRGLVLAILALALHWIGLRTQLPQLSIASLILLVWSVPFYLLGPQVARLMFFPCCYLFFCIPMNFLETVSFPLRLLGATVATWLLNGFGLEAVRSGTAIVVASGGGFSMDVADACSGIKSLMAITALSAAYAFMTQKTLPKQLTLFLLSVPFAVVGNIARILSIAIVMNFLGRELGMRFYHDFSGYLVFIIVTLLMIQSGKALNRASAGQIHE